MTRIYIGNYISLVKKIFVITRGINMTINNNKKQQKQNLLQNIQLFGEKEFCYITDDRLSSFFTNEKGCRKICTCYTMRNMEESMK